MIAVALAAASLAAPAARAASSPRWATSLSVTPTHVRLAVGASRTIRLTNSGAGSVVVDAAPAGFALDLRGRPRVAPRGRGPSWFLIRPRRLELAAGRSASLTVSCWLPRRAEPGDHPALLLLTTEPRAGSTIATRLQIGVVVVVRAPGAIVRRLEVRGLRVRRRGGTRVIELFVANRGNTTERLRSDRVTVSLIRRGRMLATIRPRRRDLLPRTVGVVAVPYGGRLHGRLTARVALSLPGLAPLYRVFRLRL